MTIEANESVLDAINTAIDSDGEDIGTTYEDQANEGLESNTESDEDLGEEEGDGSDDSDSEESGEGDGDGSGDPEPDKGKSARERNPDGTFKTAEQKAAEKAAQAGGKQPDALNDPIPTDLKKATQERIRTLIDTTKTATATAEKATQDFNYLVNGIQAAGASPSQYGEVLSWLSLFNSDAPESKAQAYEMIEQVADRMATMLGRDRQVQPPVAQHQDLQQAVQRGELTQQHANEIARNRNRDKFNSQISQEQRNAVDQQTNAQRAESDARTALNDFDASVKADPQYAEKRKAVTAQLKPIMGTIPHAQWAQAYQRAWNSVVVATKSVVPKNQPMRAGKGSGVSGAAGAGSAGHSKGQGSMLDVMNSIDFANVGRR